MSLRSKTILVTRPAVQADDLVREIERRGGTAVVIPMITIGPPASWKECDDAIGRLDRFDAVVVTSANAAESFFGRATLLGVGETALHAVRVCAVGEKTAAAARAFGAGVETVPGEYSGIALAAALGGALAGTRVLYPRGNMARDEVAEHLRATGATVEPVTVYTTSGPTGIAAESIVRRVLGGEFDTLTFASPSAVTNFCSLFSPLDRSAIPDHARVAVIGPTTADAVRSAGLPVDCVARAATALGLAEAIDEFYS
jgi:uroporphyrinogen-III synthase